MLVRCVVEDKVNDDAHTAVARPLNDLDEVTQDAEARIDAVVVADVVALIAPG
jgi:hypothetical protein